jgi:phosphatidylglycerol---prolipoprotein diacylglyceryl transferase
MYPTLFRIGQFEITTFGAMVALGAVIGLWVFARELRRCGLPDEASNGAVIGVLAGLAGAKLLFVAEHAAEEPWTELLASRGGLSWFGGLFAGVAAALAYFRWRGWSIVPILAAATPALAVGHMLGRIGCFLVGDDYGRPTSLPWAVAFPKGLPPTTVPVHPTQLYEAAFLAVLLWLLVRWRRASVPDGVVVARYLALAGTARFAIEFVRVNARVVFGLTVAQLGALIIVGIALPIARLERNARTPSQAMRDERDRRTDG